MSFFRRPDYTSEFTKFLVSYKKENPDLEALQRAGRALLWDKVVDLQDAIDYLDSRVPVRGYAPVVYVSPKQLAANHSDILKPPTADKPK